MSIDIDGNERQKISRAKRKLNKLSAREMEMAHRSTKNQKEKWQSKIPGESVAAARNDITVIVHKL